VLLEILALSSAAISLVALVRVVSTRRRVLTLSQSYWELRYEFGKLRARLAKIDGGPSADEPAETAAQAPGPANSRSA
jgi:hypothetical protein